MDTNSTKIVDTYNALVASTVISADPIQRQVVARLDALNFELASAAANGGGLAGFFTKRQKAPRGLYMWGGVGRGKTMLMDLFFDQALVAAKRRVHFHEFMDEMHDEIGKFRSVSREKQTDADPIAAVATKVIEETRLLCFDEFHVTDITNAMLLGRLFEKFFEAGMVIIATSNSAPDQLYKNGLNRQLFLPFIDLLTSHCDVFELNGAQDYRLEKLTSQPIFLFGDAASRRSGLDELWGRLIGGQEAEPGAVEVLGRRILVPDQAMGVARFEFSALCETPLGARDYLALAHHFHTVLIDDVPQFSRENSNAAKRFILLVDTFYDRGIKLAASFATSLETLSADKDTAFEFLRCVSRLQEMRSDAYLSAPRPDEPFLDEV